MAAFCLLCRLEALVLFSIAVVPVLEGYNVKGEHPSLGALAHLVCG